MTLNTYVDVDPDAKKQAVSKIEDSFDTDMASCYGDNPLNTPAPQLQVQGVTFTVEQLEAMLEMARKLEGE